MGYTESPGDAWVVGIGFSLSPSVSLSVISYTRDTQNTKKKKRTDSVRLFTRIERARVHTLTRTRAYVKVYYLPVWRTCF